MVNNKNIEIVIDCYIIDIATKIYEKTKYSDIDFDYILHNTLGYDFNNKLSSIYFTIGYFGISSEFQKTGVELDILKDFNKLLLELIRQFRFELTFPIDTTPYFYGVSQSLLKYHAIIKLKYM